MNPNDLDKAIALAEALRLFDVHYHDGGTVQKEAIETFHEAIKMAKTMREEMILQGQETNFIEGIQRDETYGEMLLDYDSRSIDGVLCALYTSLGKTYFMANMFERYVFASIPTCCSIHHDVASKTTLSATNNAEPWVSPAY